MSGTPLQRPLYACTVTFSAKSNLLALIRALGGNYTDCPGAGRSWNVQVDPGAANTSNYVLFGDENVAISPQQCFYNAGPNFTFLDRASIPGMGPIGSVWVVPDTGTCVVNVAVFSE